MDLRLTSTFIFVASEECVIFSLATTSGSSVKCAWATLSIRTLFCHHFSHSNNHAHKTGCFRVKTVPQGALLVNWTVCCSWCRYRPFGTRGFNVLVPEQQLQSQIDLDVSMIRHALFHRHGGGILHRDRQSYNYLASLTWFTIHHKIRSCMISVIRVVF